MAAVRRFRLGVDFHVWDGIFQGSRSHLVGLYRAAIRQAPDLDFIFFLDDIEGLRRAYPEFDAPHVQLVRMPLRGSVVRLGLQLPWLRVRHRVDLLHMQYRLPFLPMGPCACTIHDTLFETHPQYFGRSFVAQSRVTVRSAARRAALVFTVSAFSQAEICRLYGLRPEAVHITYNGVDRSRFAPGVSGADAVRALDLEPGNYLLNVGRLEPRKNHTTLLQAYARLSPAAPLVIVGQRDFGFDAVDETIERLGIGSRVRVLDRVGDQVLPALMRHASLFVYPAFAEGFGMPVVEAIASGVPVITSNTTALPEVASRAAITVPPDAVEALSRAMDRVLGQAELRRALVAAGESAVARFDWEQSAAVLLREVRRFAAG